MNLLHTAHVPAGTGPFPTVISLHGWGASAHDLLGLAPLILSGEALVLCPQGPVAFSIGPGANGYGWFPLRSGRAPDPADFSEGARQLEEFLHAALESYPVDRQRLLLMGFSQGGVMAYELFLRRPRDFVGLVALSSWLPRELCSAVLERSALANRPVLIMHGTKDAMIDVERARESRSALRELGVALHYREYEMGHEIAPDALRELLGWLQDNLGSRIIAL